jgi:putative CocE/NonD family hydrolase
MLNNKTQAEYKTRHQKNIEITMRDGTILRHNMTRPDIDGKFPVLLERSPYNKEGGSENGVGSPEFFASRGYVVIIQDVRGRFASDGDFYPFKDDGNGPNKDGYDTVEWLAKQDWSTGKIGTIGGSYSGATQYRNAISNPPNVKAMFVRESSADYSEEWVYRGGAFELGFNLGWAHRVTLSNLNHLVTDEKHEETEKMLIDIENNLDDWHKKIPLFPTQYFNGLSDWYNDWLENPPPSDYWKEFDMSDHFGNIDIPIYHLGGWFDVFLNGTLKFYQGVSKNGKSDKTKQNQRLIVGPWVHGPTNINNRFAGEFDFGPDAALDFNELRLPWFDFWLKGKNNGIDKTKKINFFLMGKNEWKQADEWPLKNTTYTKYYFNKKLNGEIKSLYSGTLSDKKEIENSQLSFTNNLNNPVPSLGGNTLSIPNGVFEHSSVDKQCITFSTDPLENELEVTGSVSAEIYVNSDQENSDWVVRLCDVDQSGYSRLVCDGIYRSHATSGEIQKIKIDMWATSNMFLKGHRLRISVTGSCFPRFDRALNNSSKSSENNILCGGSNASYITLPIINN